MRGLFIIITVLLISCGTSKNMVSAADWKDDREISIKVDNPTGYDVYIEGNIEKRIGKKSNNNMVTLLIEDGTLSSGFNIYYEIPLSNSVSLFYKGDHRTFREKQVSFTLTQPRSIENYGTYIALTNRANNAVRFLSGGTVNPAWVQTGSPKMGNNLTRSSKREFNPHETVVFKIDINAWQDNHLIRDGRKDSPLILPQNLSNNYLYSFEYTANGVVLTDSRPLYRIGEESWFESINTAGTEPIQLVAAADAINVFASTERGLLRNTYDSAGNVVYTQPSEYIPYLTFAGAAEGGFLVAGYEKLANGDYRPIARIQNSDGTTRCALAHSNKYGTARFFTAAQKDTTTWLLAGDGAKTGTYGNTAYARLVRLEGDKLTELWERGGDEFNCGEIKSAAYDYIGDRWLVTGDDINQNGSFIAVISNNGSITIDHLFKDMTFNKIVIDRNGNCYLAGDEQIMNETNAALIKYYINDKKYVKISTPPPSHSYYYDVLPDTANNRIILGGVMKAADGTGQGGVPFIEIMDLQTGTSLREELSDPEIKKTGAVLVTAIVPAPDYGFALALSGIVNGYYGNPFLIARVNSQGKYIRRIR